MREVQLKLYEECFGDELLGGMILPLADLEVLTEWDLCGIFDTDHNGAKGKGAIDSNDEDDEGGNYRTVRDMKWFRELSENYPLVHSSENSSSSSSAVTSLGLQSVVFVVLRDSICKSLCVLLSSGCYDFHSDRQIGPVLAFVKSVIELAGEGKGKETESVRGVVRTKLREAALVGLKNAVEMSRFVIFKEVEQRRPEHDATTSTPRSTSPISCECAIAISFLYRGLVLLRNANLWKKTLFNEDEERKRRPGGKETGGVHGMMEEDGRILKELRMVIKKELVEGRIIPSLESLKKGTIGQKFAMGLCGGGGDLSEAIKNAVDEGGW